MMDSVMTRCFRSGLWQVGRRDAHPGGRRLDSPIAGQGASPGATACQAPQLGTRFRPMSTNEISLPGKIKGWIFIIVFMAVIAFVAAILLRGVTSFF